MSTQPRFKPGDVVRTVGDCAETDRVYGTSTLEMQRIIRERIPLIVQIASNDMIVITYGLDRSHRWMWIYSDLELVGPKGFKLLLQQIAELETQV